MITKNTVFILGAGASVPYGFPTGEGLRSLICKKFNEKYKEYIIPHYTNEDKLGMDYFLNNFVEPFMASGISIDSFLSNNYEDEDINCYGKQSIALFILEAEKKSLSHDNFKYNQDWFSVLFDKMIDGIKMPNGYLRFAENKVTFITFNYDRLLEKLLYNTLKNAYLSADDIAISNILQSIPIYHVYGQLSKLSWQINRRIPGINIIDYGEDISSSVVQLCCENINTMYRERKQTNKDFYANILREAERIFFLGFGYQQENMDVLGLDYKLFDIYTRIYGTAYQFSEKQIHSVKQMFLKGYALDNSSYRQPVYKPTIENLNCKSLLLDNLND